MPALRRWLFYPFLFAVSPALALLAQNATQVKVLVGARAILASFLLGAIVFTILRMVIQDAGKAAMVTSFLLILFFSYGHVYSSLKQTAVFGILLGRHRILFPFWLGLFALGSWLVLNYLKDNQTANETLNVIAMATLIIPLVQLTSFEVRSAISRSNSPLPALNAGKLQAPEGQMPPDIYYIILDAYARSDVLLKYYDYDNTSFLDSLKDMGFFVAHCSLSNYAQTELSMASSLNFNYLETLSDDFGSESEDRSGLWPLIRQSAVRRALKELGYTDVAFETGYYWTQIEDADFYLSASTTALDALEVVGGVNSFEVMFVNTTAGLLLTDAASVLPDFFGEAVRYPFHRHRERVLYDFNKLRSVPLNIPGPKFVYAHIIAPHEPFVFGPEGETVYYEEPLDEQHYGRAYANQITFVNHQMAQILDEIIATSQAPPIIILQADHGNAHVTNDDRMAILNAYYLPDGGDQLLYESISPVNTFRVVFNHYFGGNYPLLEDKSYFSGYDRPFNYRLVTDPNPTCPE